MTSIFASQNIQSDYICFEEELLKSSNVIVDIDDTFKIHLKKYHKLVYALALFPLKIKGIESEKNKFVFLFEIQSDLLNVISLLILGFNFPSKMLFRRSLENFYNHIYYSDHAVEFTHLNLGRNEYTPLNGLKDYFTNHPKFKNINDDNLKTFNEKIFENYVELNKIVHSKGIAFMGLSKNIQEIKFADDYIEFIKSCNETLICAIYLLYKFHKDIDFSMVENRLIVDCVPKDKRRKMTE
jgi:hypothetical protein